MYEKLKNTYNTFVNRFLSEDQKQQHNIQPETGRFALPSDETTTVNDSQEHTLSTAYASAPKSVKERGIVNRDGKAVLVTAGNPLEEAKLDNTGAFTDDAQGYNNMVIMKHGDEDLVEDEASVIVNTASKRRSTLDQKEDVVINESTAEQKVTGNIPMLRNNKNALIRNTKPFSSRLRSGELHIDINDIHAVAN